MSGTWHDTSGLVASRSGATIYVESDNPTQIVDSPRKVAGRYVVRGRSVPVAAIVDADAGRDDVVDALVARVRETDPTMILCGSFARRARLALIVAAVCLVAACGSGAWTIGTLVADRSGDVEPTVTVRPYPVTAWTNEERADWFRDLRSHDEPSTTFLMMWAEAERLEDAIPLASLHVANDPTRGDGTDRTHVIAARRLLQSFGPARVRAVLDDARVIGERDARDVWTMIRGVFDQ